MSKERLIELAKQAGWEYAHDDRGFEPLWAFAELVRADERENGQKWFDAATAQHKQLILAEREACAKVCEAHSFRVRGFLDDDLLECKLADAIRARGGEA